MTDKQPFTPGLSEVLELSKAEARRLGSPLIEPDHHILGILRKGDGLAIETLQELDVDLKRLGEFILAQVEQGSAPVADVITPSKPSILLLESAGSIAKSFGHGWIGTEHLLIALVESQHSALSQFLNESGITSSMVREAVHRVIIGQSKASQWREVEEDDELRHWQKGPVRNVGDALWLQFPLNVGEALQDRFSNSDDLVQFLKDKVSTWELGSAMGKELGVPFITLANFTIEPHVIQAIPPEYVRANRILPVDLSDNVLTIAVADPAGLSKQEELARITKRQVVFVISFSEQIDEVIARYFPAET